MEERAFKRIVCIGAANIDRKVKLCNPVQYQTSNPAETSFSSGGVARNVAENLARLQCSVDLITLFGEDQERDQLCKFLRKLRIDYQLSRTLPQQRTGNYTCVNNPNGEMVLATADMAIYDHFSLSWLAELWPQIATAEWIFLDANLPAESLQWLIQKAAQDQVMLCVDPVSAPKAIKLPEQLDGVEIIFPDIREAEALSGVSWQGIASCQEIWKRLLERGLKKIVISLGSAGVFAATTTECEVLPAPAVHVKDVTGAGDSLVAGVIWGLRQNLSFFEACEMGICNASLTIQTEENVFSELTSERLLSQKRK